MNIGVTTGRLVLYLVICNCLIAVSMNFKSEGCLSCGCNTGSLIDAGALSGIDTDGFLWHTENRQILMNSTVTVPVFKDF